MKLRNKILFSLIIFLIVQVNGQDIKSPGVISGNIQTIGQYYQEDTIINDFESNLYQGVVMKLEIESEIENIKKNINSIRRYL